MRPQVQTPVPPEEKIKEGREGREGKEGRKKEIAIQQ
jgi:hypothetical protein